MQISLKWINELIDLQTINLDNLITKLTLGGFEVEEILEVEIENTTTTALEISATANRSDSLSIQGLSLEIAALLNCPTKVSKYFVKNYSWSDQLKDFELTNLSENPCSSFIALTIENLNHFGSPKWLQQKLFASGIIPENNLIDFQNYIILETGYPIEFYDLNKIYKRLNNQQIQLQLVSSKSLVGFLANNDLEYSSIDKSILHLKANDLTISIAGIISSKDSSYLSPTNALLIEASIFNATRIRQQSRKLGLRTNRSSRYEKSLKDTNLLNALYRFISLLRIANPRLICKLHTVAFSVNQPVKIIKLEYKKIKQILGPIKKLQNNLYEFIPPEIITDSLERLNFEVIYNARNWSWKVKIPPLRNDDISRDIDLIEEIGRIYGFNNFLTRLPNIKVIGSEDFDYQTRKKITSCFINLGLNELIQYSLVKEKTYLKTDIELVNPLTKEYSNLRSSLLPNLVKAIEENLKKGNPILEGFEYGHVFYNHSLEIFTEIEFIAGIFGGGKLKPSWSESSNLLNWFEAKGKIEQFFKKLNIIVYWKSYRLKKEEIILHPYCTVELILGKDQRLGIFGQISPILAKKLNIPMDIYLFEFNFELLKSQIQQNKLSLYKDYSVYPRITKDLSFVINNNISFENIKDILYFNGSQFLKEIYLLDEYRGSSIPKNYTSLCLQLVFQSDYETLESQKVDKIVKSLVKLLRKKFNLTIRD